MSAVSTFRNIRLSTTYNQDFERSLLSLDWVLDSGIPCQRSVASGVLAIPCMDSAVFSTISTYLLPRLCPVISCLVVTGCNSVVIPFKMLASSCRLGLWICDAVAL
ncbi:hypothetical protein R3P38DRAFT_3127292, partial [Favolaschia claudopus]